MQGIYCRIGRYQLQNLPDNIFHPIIYMLFIFTNSTCDVLVRCQDYSTNSTGIYENTMYVNIQL